MRVMMMGVLLAGLAGPALADEPRELCAERPGLGTPPCIVDRGRIVVEAGGVNWSLDRDAESRADVITAGALQLRYGLTDTTELQLGWTAFGHRRERDKASGMLDRAWGTGDVRLSIKQNFANPDGSGLALAVLPYATLPTGGTAIGAGDWGAGIVLPVTAELPGGIVLELTPEIDAAVDEDRKGRHLAYGSVAGVAVPMGKTMTTMMEVSVVRDQDPAHRETHALAGLSLAWQRGDDLILDAGTNLGLNRDTDDVALYVGLVRRF